MLSHLEQQRALEQLEDRWYCGIVGASVLFGGLLAWPWFRVALHDDPAVFWVGLAAWAIGGSLFKLGGLAVAQWARGWEYDTWQQRLNRHRDSDRLVHTVETRHLRAYLDQAIAGDLTRLGQVKGVERRSWFRRWKKSEWPAHAHAWLAGDVRALRRALHAAGQPCATWQLALPAVRQARRDYAQNVAQRIRRRYSHVA